MTDGELNILWSVPFFCLQRPVGPWAQNGALWRSIALLWMAAPQGDRRVRWLIAPCFAGVSFAAILNVAAVNLNVAFSAD